MTNPYEHFNDRFDDHGHGLRNLPSYLIDSDLWEYLEEILTDLTFIEANCAAGMTYDLVTNYATALDKLPETQKEKQKELEHEERIRKYIKDLIAFSQGEIPNLEIIPSLKPWNDEEIREYTKNVINNPSRLDRIRAFSQFVNTESHALAKFSSMPGFCIQHAYNSANSGPVGNTAKQIIMSFKITKQSLENLRNEGISDTILENLKFIENKEFANENKFLNIVKQQIGEQQIFSYKEPILKYAINIKIDEVLFLQIPSQRLNYTYYPALLKIFEGHSDEVKSVSVLADGERAISGSVDGTLRVWDIESGKCLKVIEGYAGNNIDITPDGKKAVSGGDNKTLRVWDLERGECLKIIEGLTDRITCVSVTPDGKKAISGSGDHWGTCEDKTLRVWDLENGECLGMFDGHTGGVESVNITIDGKKAVSGGVEGSLRLWDLENKKCLATFETFRSAVTSISITPDAKKVIAGSYDGGILLWDIEIWECISLEGHKDAVTSVSITADGKRAVSGSEDGTLLIWDLESKNCLRRLKGHTAWVTSVSITPDGKIGVSGSGGIWGKNEDKSVRVWDIEHGECITTIKRASEEATVGSINLTLDGKIAVSAGGDDETTRLWDTESGKCLKTIETENSHGAIITPDGKRIVSWGGYKRGGGIMDTTLRVRDIETGEYLKHIRPRKEQIVKRVGITPDGKRVISGGSTLQVGCFKSGRWLWGYKGPVVDSISISLDGRNAVSGSMIGKLVRIWDIESGECLKELEGHTESAVCVDISPDQKIVISGSWDKTLRVWDIESGKCLIKLEGHTASVESVRITPDGRRAISGSWDNTLRIWNLKSGECIAVHQARSPVFELSEIRANGVLGYGTSAGEIIFMKSYNLFAFDLVTPVRMWLYKKARNWLLFQLFGESGQWEDEIKVTCYKCGRRFPVSEEILEIIMSIQHHSKLSPMQSPCLELPTETWNEPKLLSKCPNCQCRLRYNPFIVDNKK